MTISSKRTAVSAAVLAAVATGLVVPPASAHEPREIVRLLTPTAWGEPLEALGGTTLAAYVARHQERVLDTTGV